MTRKRQLSDGMRDTKPLSDSVRRPGSIWLSRSKLFSGTMRRHTFKTALRGLLTTVASARMRARAVESPEFIKPPRIHALSWPGSKAPRSIYNRPRRSTKLRLRLRGGQRAVKQTIDVGTDRVENKTRKRASPLGPDLSSRHVIERR